jgi:DNA-binding transcriptional ArsR family regulator
VDEVPKRNGAGIELLADPTRRQIIALVALRPRRPSGLAKEIGLSRPATSRQLRLLEEAGLIRGGRFVGDGRVVLYIIDQRQHGRITAWLAGTEIARPTRPAGPDNGGPDMGEPDAGASDMGGPDTSARDMGGPERVSGR